uniref:Uncharacterized protein n=1 Tax=Anguilla anguilla TaxID=7936 RepID=A0A0E9XGZ3_ANGAN
MGFVKNATTCTSKWNMFVCLIDCFVGNDKKIATKINNK